MYCFFMIVGLIVGLVGGIMLLVSAFRESVWWGLGYLFVPFVSLAFVIMHWEENKKAFLIHIAGLGIMLIGVFMAPGNPRDLMKDQAAQEESADDDDDDDSGSDAAGASDGSTTPSWEQSWQERQRQAERAPERPVVPGEYAPPPSPATDMQRFEQETQQREREAAAEEQAQEAPPPPE